MLPCQIQRILENSHPFLKDSTMRNQKISRKISHFVHGVAAEYSINQNDILDLLTPFSITFFDKSFPLKTFENIIGGSPAATEICQLITSISWKQTGKGEVLMAMKAGIRKDPSKNSRGDGVIGTKRYNIKNIHNGACLKSRPNEDRALIYADRQADASTFLYIFVTRCG